MGLKPDHWIKKMALEHKMIEPFVDEQVSAGTISYGLSSFGYDIRVADEFRIFTPATGRRFLIRPGFEQIDVRCAHRTLPPDHVVHERTQPATRALKSSIISSHTPT